MTPAELARRLSDPNVEARRAAVVEAGVARQAALGAGLVAALGDDDWRVREEATEVVVGSAVELGLLPALVQALCQGENVGLRNAAREALLRLGGAAAQELVASLPRVDERSRKFLIEALACGGTDDAVATLARAVHGADEVIAVAAMDALATLGGEAAVQVLRDKLRCGEVFEQTAALHALERVGARVPFSELSALLSSPLLRRVALPLLGGTGDARALPVLLDALYDRSAHALDRALLSLITLRSREPSVAEALRAALATLPDDVRARVRERAASDAASPKLAALAVLCLAGDREAAGIGAQLVAGGQSVERVAAELRELPGALPLLLDVASRAGVLAAPALELALELPAALAPAEAASAPLRTVLRALLLQGDPATVHVALRGLARVGDAADLAPVLALAQGEDQELGAVAAEALRALAVRARDAARPLLAGAVLGGAAGEILAALSVELEGAQARPKLRDALLSDDVRARVSALAGLRRLGDGESIALIVLALRDAATEVQVAALDALGALPQLDPAAVSALLGFESGDPDVQVAHAHALTALRDDRAVAQLTRLARASVPGVRLFALQGLLASSSAELPELLVEALGDADVEVVKHALSGLARLGGARALPRIAIALDHPAWDVRRHAALWLGQARGDDAARALRARLGVESDPSVREALSAALASASGVS